MTEKFTLKQAINVGLTKYLPDGWEVIPQGAMDSPYLFINDKHVIANWNDEEGVHWTKYEDDAEIKKRITEVILAAYENQNKDEIKKYAEEKEAFRKFIGL